MQVYKLNDAIKNISKANTYIYTHILQIILPIPRRGPWKFRRTKAI